MIFERKNETEKKMREEEKESRSLFV